MQDAGPQRSLCTFLFQPLLFPSLPASTTSLSLLSASEFTAMPLGSFLTGTTSEAATRFVTPSAADMPSYDAPVTASTTSPLIKWAWPFGKRLRGDFGATASVIDVSQ